jgi:inosine-uridine nucleoside N-ribohydrolase
MRRESSFVNVALVFMLGFSLLLSSCHKATPTPVQTTTIPSPVQTTPPTLPTPTSFLLAGKWTGTAINGSYTMDAIIDFNSACSVGEICGYYNLLSIPCAGSYTLQNINNGTYEFTSGDFIGNCSASHDFFQVSPTGVLQYTSRGDFGETTGALNPIHPIPVIYDDDGSPDGMLALMYFLSDPRVSLKSVSISYGEANPSTYIQLIGALLDSFGFTDIPLGFGKSAHLSGNNAFPEWMRQSANNFWNQPVPKTNQVYHVKDAAQLMVDTLNNSPEPITVFISGPCTNLAEALRLDPGIKDHIKAVFIMGGALYTEGNLSDLVSNPENNLAEWNIYADAVAASEVFQSGLEIYLVPLDATNQVAVTHTDTAVWRNGGKPAQFAANLYDQQITGVNRESFYYWDAMTAEILVNPALCQFSNLAVEVITIDGKRDGQTRVVTMGEPNIHACLQPDAINLVNTIDSIFAASK